MTQSHNTVRVTLECSDAAEAKLHSLNPPKLFTCDEIQYKTHSWYSRATIYQDLTPLPPHTVAQLLDKIIITDPPSRLHPFRSIEVDVTTLYTAPQYTFQDEPDVSDVPPPPHTTAKLKTAGQAHTYHFRETEDEIINPQFLSDDEMTAGITRLDALSVLSSTAVYQTIFKYGFTGSCFVSTDTLRRVASAMYEFDVNLCHRFLHQRIYNLKDAEIFEYLIVCFITNCKDGFDLAAERLANEMTKNREASNNLGFLNIHRGLLAKLPFDVLEEVIKSTSFVGRSKLQWRLVVGHTKAWQDCLDVSLRGPTNLNFSSASKYLHATLTFFVSDMVLTVTKDEYDSCILPYVDLAIEGTHTELCRPNAANWEFGAGWSE
ncbi:hypothetical protein HDU79_000310 [Rhizoclosmatium sp. JEL0117]|nr:hypothetical protein HDU79_000310 [Rhizoclosmatium sp. JEL0117]